MAKIIKFSPYLYKTFHSVPFASVHHLLISEAVGTDTCREGRANDATCLAFPAWRPRWKIRAKTETENKREVRWEVQAELKSTWY